MADPNAGGPPSPSEVDSHGPIELSDEALKELDPHATKGVQAPPWPAEPADWIKKGLLYRWFDYGLYQFEKVCVVLGLALMATLSFTITVYENMSGQEQHATLKYGAIILAILGGLSAPGLKQKHIAVRLGAGCGAAGALALYAWLVATQTTHVAYFSLIGAGIAGAALAVVLVKADDDEGKALRKERLVLLATLVAAAVPVGLFISSVPESYSDGAKYNGLLLFWVGFLGASMTTYHRAHLQIDFVRKKLKGRALHFYNAASLMVTIGFTGLLFILTYNYIFGPEGNYYNRRTEGELPDWTKVMAIAFSVGVMLMRFTAHAIEDILKGIRNTPDEDAAPAAPVAPATSNDGGPQHV